MSNPPHGRVRLIANGGIAQQYTAGAAQSGCRAAHILPPLHKYIEDTLPSLSMAWRMGTDMAAVDVARTRDGVLVLYPDATLDCRTGAKGPVSDHDLAEIRTLDAGWGYTADGHSFPLRGTAIGAIPTLAEALRALPGLALQFRFATPDPALAPALVTALKAAGRDPGTLGDGFSGSPAQIATIGQAWPKAWAFDPVAATACGRQYRLTGWTTVFPAACRGATMAIPLGGSLSLWGWPNRLQERLTANATAPLMFADPANRVGFTHARQIGEIARDYVGYAMVDDYWTVGPALRPSRDMRTVDEANAALDRDQSGS